MKKERVDKQALIRYRLDQAREVLKDAHALYDLKRTPISIVNRAYSMFYAVLALMISIDKDTAKHQGALAYFDEYFVKQKVFPKEMSRFIHDAFESRQEGDYRESSKIDRETAGEILQSADVFLGMVEKKLNEGSIS
ncbi:MAG: HEPN domain-containing protein [Anaerolineales bacterium]|nr:HEPN domain-containing protein [Anaerolineales bacterium]